MIRAVRAARFRPGDAVRVPNVEKRGHVRTPRYVKGKQGRVTGILGEFPDPESLAYGGTGLPEKPLYRVAFRQADLWEGYEGAADDTLHVDIYEHWLEPAEEGEGG
ncbi:MAG: Nitrile hydratase beta subunit [uncultured Rubrobacteraceae bacterium]|uniref:Nitrile hydratase beta subunit n=1 Tax=uncultured Rubrobacteraceae bacterium TaxID=349277 RepID=A0A6J4REG0_9ACTN|nr:MAG: Nitrile hydratase beta subunit [uncultured Rubrobacteraceae bacterium]